MAKQRKLCGAKLKGLNDCPAIADSQLPKPVPAIRVQYRVDYYPCGYCALFQLFGRKRKGAIEK